MRPTRIRCTIAIPSLRIYTALTDTHTSSFLFVSFLSFCLFSVSLSGSARVTVFRYDTWICLWVCDASPVLFFHLRAECSQTLQTFQTHTRAAMDCAVSPYLCQNSTTRITAHYQNSTTRITAHYSALQAMRALQTTNTAKQYAKQEQN